MRIDRLGFGLVAVKIGERRMQFVDRYEQLMLHISVGGHKQMQLVHRLELRDF